MRRFLVDTWLSSLRGKPRVRQESQLSAWDALRVIQWWQSVARLQSFVPSYLHADVESSSCPSCVSSPTRPSVPAASSKQQLRAWLGPLSRYQHAATGEPQEGFFFEMISSVVHSFMPCSARSRVLIASHECTPRAWCCGHSKLRHWAARVTAFQVLYSASAINGTVRATLMIDL